MEHLKRTAVYFDPKLYKALRLKAVQTDRSVSDLVNDAVQCSLSEDGADLAVFDARAKEPNLDLEGALKELKRRDKP
jgi:hypothetical protein